MPGLRDVLRDQIVSTLARLLPRGSEVAFVNFPNHHNTGDSAVWLATWQVLRRLGARVRYVCQVTTYDPAMLARRLGPGGTILLQGGGNFGDVYHRQQGVRERVLEEFRNVRTIQLPQSLWFRDTQNRDRMRRLCEQHRDFTLLVREDASEAYARMHFDVRIERCPDMVFALEDVPRRREPEVDVLWLAREDRETVARSMPEPLPRNVRRIDWLGPLPVEPAPPPALALNTWLAERAKSRAVARWLWRSEALTFPAMAAWRIARGCSVLDQGRAVITDRLHGHILCILLGIPHVLMDNLNGKVRSTWETWTRPSPLVSWADDPKTALDLAYELAASEPPKTVRAAS